MILQINQITNLQKIQSYKRTYDELNIVETQLKSIQQKIKLPIENTDADAKNPFAGFFNPFTIF